MLLFALALVLTTLVAAGLPSQRVVVTVRPGTQSVSLRRGQRVVLVNGDIRPHRLAEPHIRLDRPGDAGTLRFPKPGVYVLHTYAGPSLVPWIEGDPRTGATLRLTVR